MQLVPFQTLLYGKVLLRVLGGRCRGFEKRKEKLSKGIKITEHVPGGGEWTENINPMGVVMAVAKKRLPFKNSS